MSVFNEDKAMDAKDVYKDREYTYFLKFESVKNI